MMKYIKGWFRSYHGRHFLSRWVRKVFEKDWIKKAFGLNLAAVFMLAAVIEPRVETVSAEQILENVNIPNQTINVETKTETTLSWPVGNPEISQGYHFGHWGMDILDKENTKIYPVDKGWVSQVVYAKWEAYGNHLILQHPNNRSSLYAHLESINVQAGDEVNRETAIGTMGKTGFATGVHLHLEIYQNGKNVNPFEILPKLN